MPKADMKQTTQDNETMIDWSFIPGACKLIPGKPVSVEAISDLVILDSLIKIHPSIKTILNHCEEMLYNDAKTADSSEKKREIAGYYNYMKSYVSYMLEASEKILTASGVDTDKLNSDAVISLFSIKKMFEAFCFHSCTSSAGCSQNCKVNEFLMFICEWRESVHETEEAEK